MIDRTKDLPEPKVPPKPAKRMPQSKAEDDIVNGGKRRPRSDNAAGWTPTKEDY